MHFHAYQIQRYDIRWCDPTCLYPWASDLTIYIISYSVLQTKKNELNCYRILTKYKKKTLHSFSSLKLHFSWVHKVYTLYRCCVVHAMLVECDRRLGRKQFKRFLEGKGLFLPFFPLKVHFLFFSPLAVVQCPTFRIFFPNKDRQYVLIWSFHNFLHWEDRGVFTATWESTAGNGIDWDERVAYIIRSVIRVVIGWRSLIDWLTRSLFGSISAMFPYDVQPSVRNLMLTTEREIVVTSPSCSLFHYLTDLPIAVETLRIFIW